ncbi:collagen alpha-4(VI) chain-like isoform X2 [Haliotis rufescens]|uniref:collagen alpha-4(VI) chain-like isoform X2 n=1 Tax=Haliotis rufescens TaxID=6454 RepID=UPI00201F10E0|nr:collagen alpha-4(VI) chain-like isoform X2 [Haliotis rufescens]
MKLRVSMVMVLLLGLTSAQTTDVTPDVFTLNAGASLSTVLKAVTATPSTTTQAECHSVPADLVFLLDSSGSEGATNFKDQLTFVSNIVDKFDIGPDKVQVSVATFETTVNNAFWLDDYTNKADVLNAIKKIQYGGGTTATDQALTHALQESFSDAHGARNNSNKIIFVLTDGQSTKPALTADAANKIHNTNIRVIAIGIGSSISSSELDTIATDKQHVYRVANFSGLADIEKEVEQQTCKTEGLVCKSTPADILFLLDASASEGTNNFDKQLNFIKNFTKDFTIGPDAVQIALATFSTTTTPAFWFNDYDTSTDLMNAIDKVKYLGGNTHTESALKLGETAFTAANGARNNSNHLIIILTDGQSSDKTQTKAAANSVHNAGTQVIAIGIGNSIDQQEIKDIASGDGDQNAFAVADFDALQTIEKEIQSQTCKTQTACSSRPADVVFLLDTSSSEGSENFKKQLNFVNNFARELNIGPNNVQLSVVTFATNVKNEFWLNNFTTKADLLNAVQNVQYRPGITETGEGLKFVGANSFLPQHGGRPDAQQVVIVVTDGESQQKSVTANEAEKLHSAGIKVISVGIGTSIDNGELTALASDPSFVFRVADFDALQKIETEIRQTTCKAPQTACKSDPVDIVFLLDSSSSEGSINFKKQLEFVSNFVDGFDIGPDSVQIGVVTFSTAVTNRYFLNDYNSKAALKAAITSIPYTGGNTVTGDGLEFIRTNSLSAAHGARADARQVVIVMTDGQSQLPAYTKEQAKLLHDKGVKVIAVGIGNGIVSTELNNIASDKQHVFMVTGFDALHTIETELQLKTCNKLVCASSAADIVFVLDSSSSEGLTNFKKQVTFVQKFVDQFDVSSTAVQFSIVVFSTAVYPQFDLDKYASKAALLAAIKNVEYHTGVTYTGKALLYVNQTTLTTAHGARPSAAKIVIVITDGQSSSRYDTQHEANVLHKAGVEVMAIGIGIGVNHVELDRIASDAKHVFSVTNFDALKTIQNELQQTTCAVQGTAVPATTKPRPCPVSEKADVIFLLDASSSEGSSNFQKELDFVSKFVNDFDIGPDHMQFGAIRFSTSASLVFDLNSHTTKASLQMAVASISYTGGTTYTDKALALARGTGFTSTHGARPDAKRYVIVITDGESMSPTQTLTAATNLKNDGVSIITIGVGTQVRQSELDGMATDKTHVFTVKDFNVLQTIHKEVQKKTCTDAGLPLTTTMP